MQSIQYNFKSIPVVPDSANLIDIILSKTQRKTPTVTHPGYNITRVRKFYMRKIRFTFNSIQEKLEGIVKGFPKLEEIHPFYADLINILYDKDHFKMALGYINTGKNLCEKVSKDYVKLMKYGDHLYRCKQLKIAALGRMATIIKKLNSSLKYLEEVRKHLGRMPSIDPYTRTLLLTGFPNVGKSSFMNKITTAESEVQPYPFTTQSLWAGQTTYKNIKWQVIDTPGILDRPLEERNNIEMQAINALAHLDAAILYFIDISEECGYSLEKQISLFNSIRPLFKNKPLIIVLNKIDIQPFETLEDVHKEALKKAAEENNTYLIKMSNISNIGVVDVKTTACDILLEFRMANTNKLLKTGNKLDQFENRIHVAEPAKRDNRNRPSNIPGSVAVDRKIEEDEKKNRKVDEEEELLKTLREGEDEGHERFITKNRVKDMMNQNGGDGVFYIPDRAHFVLENPDWNDDVWPEIMDGKNVFDFIDVDIKEKIEKLERQEEELAKQYENNNMEVDDEDSDLDSEMLDEHDTVMENQKKIRDIHKSVKTSQIPRKVRDLTLTEQFMADLRTDKHEDISKLKAMSNKKRTEEKTKTKNFLVRQAKLRDEDIESDDESEDDKMLGKKTKKDGMEIDDEDVKAKGKGKLTKEEKLKRKKEEELRKVIAQRMKDKIQKKFNRKGIIDDTDRRIGTVKPVHLNTGKRGIGKTDWR